MEIPTFQTLSDDCLRVADALYNARHDIPRLASLACLLTAILGFATSVACIGVVIRQWLSSVLLFLNLGQLLLCLLLITAEAGRVLHLSSMDQCMETRFGFFSNVTSRAIIYFYLGLSCMTLGHLTYLCYFTGLLFMGAGVISIVFRRRQVPPEGEVLPNY
ncbi:hypothetical protein cyc_01913 [Cyclospora cayetanensis]|uniref:COPI associated protein n=1 Tax=Cyclospora cayetanensis TaxID=88456 RepID=A0A1D3CSS2_9EIME|nr:hypothetical protein cyc_01913 [Cyclospora cayetanensis]